MFEQGHLRCVFLHEAVAGKLLWQIEAEMRGGDVLQTAKLFAQYVDSLVRCAIDTADPADSIMFSRDARRACDRICAWLYAHSPAVLMDTLATVKEQTMERLYSGNVQYAGIQNITARLNNGLLTLMMEESLTPVHYTAYAKAFIALRNDSNLMSGDDMDAPTCSTDINFLEKMVGKLREIPSHIMRARFAAHIMDGCIEWCYSETERKIKRRTDKVFSEAKECFETAIAVDNHPIFMAQLLLELEDTLVNTREMDGELHDVLDTAVKTVKERLFAQEYRRTMTAAEFIAHEFK